jgi:hypothetical protein
MYDQSALLMPLTLAVLWLVAAGVCRGQATPALICSAPLAILLSWFVWMQTQGWPGSGDQRFSTLGEFAVAVLLGLILGRLARSQLTRRRVASPDVSDDAVLAAIADRPPLPVGSIVAVRVKAIPKPPTGNGLAEAA